MAVRINLCLLSIIWIPMLSGVLPYPNGAPDSPARTACSHMTPDHTPISPSVKPPIFTISVSTDTFHLGVPVKVTIRMKQNDTKIMGFMIQAVRANSGSDENTAVGTFQAIPGTKLICQERALTHSARGEWLEVAVDWTLSNLVATSVQFRVTVVKDYDTFWVDERSPVIYEYRHTPRPTLPPTTHRPFVLDVTDGCGESKGCYRNPPGCSEETCDIVVTWKNINNYSYEFAMSADTDGWVALGISEDKFMGDDNVVECIWKEDEGTVEVRFSVNDGKENKEITHRAQPMIGTLNLVDWNHSKGRLRCQFVRSFRRSGVAKAAKAQSSYLFMAKGPVENGRKLRHSLEPNKYPYVSPSMVSMNEKEDITNTARYPLVKAHGCLMLIAWMMCASTALLLSKYYKRMWPNDSLCGVEVWFAVHRALMIICLILTAIAFILIFLHVGGYSHMPDYPDKAHPPLGICVMILVILNPFITLFRCNPKSKYRPIFNWFHWLFGTVAYVLQLPAIFIGLNLHKAFVPPWATWIMTAFILFHLIIELLLEIHGCLNARKQKRRDDDFERTKKTDFKGEYQGLKEEPVGHRFKKIVLSIYLVVVIILGVIMVIAVAAG